jgi:hypothetical protein
MIGSRPSALAWTILGAVVALATLTLALVAFAGHAAAQTDPPPLGLGDWTVSDTTVLQDRFVLLNGSLTVAPGGDLTMRNSTIIFVLNSRGEHGLIVQPGGALRVLDGSRIAGSRLGMGWTFMAQAGSTLRVVGSSIEDCGNFGYGYSANWQVISFYIGTEDAVLEGSSFRGGFVGPCYPDGVIAPPPRNCTFESYYGVVTWGTSVEECTFLDQLYYGVLVMGGTETVVRRCTFDGVFGASISVGLDERPVGPIDVATALVDDCRFYRASVGVRCAVLSHATISGCSFDGMATAGIYPEQGMNDDPEDIVAYVELLNGDFVNTSVVILPAWRAWVNWTVTGEATVIGGNLSLPGDLVLADGAHLRLLECRDLTQANRPGKPARISLGAGAHLEVVNGSLLAPRLLDKPNDWEPIRLDGAQGQLTLVGASTVNVSFPVQLKSLRCERTRLPLGEWTVRKAELVDCVLQRARGGASRLNIWWGGYDDHSTMVRCALDGLPAQDSRPWLDVLDSDLVSEDTLFDLLSNIEAGHINLNQADQFAMVSAYWSADALVRWQNQAPAPGAEVTVWDIGGNATVLTTDAGGSTPVVLLLTEVASYHSMDASRLSEFESVSVLYPFRFEANMSGIRGETVVQRVAAPLDVVITIKDLVPPVIRLDQPAFIATNRPIVHLTGSASDAHSGIAFLEAAVLPHPYARVQVSPNGTFAVDLPLTTGLQPASLRLYDSVGNRAVLTITVFYTQIPPFINVTEPINGAWANTTIVHIVGITVTDATVEIRGRTQVAVDGAFRIPVPVAEGENVLLVNATDLAGNHNQTYVVVNVDTVPPGLLVISPPHSPYATRESPEEVEGKTDPGARAFINSVEIPVDPFGAFSAKVTLRQGPQVVTVMAMDAAGNRAVRELVFSLDSRPPALSVLWPPAEELLTNASPLEVRLLTDVGAVLTINGKQVPVTGPTVTFALNLSEGANAIVIKAYDAAGNGVEVHRTARFHHAPPALRLQPAPPGRTADPFLRLSGVTEANSTLVINGLRVSVFSDGVFSRVVLLSEGLNRIQVVATDEYGNRANVTYAVEMVPTQPPPHEGRPTLVWALLTLSALAIGVEAALLLVRRSRVQGPQRTGKGG